MITLEFIVNIFTIILALAVLWFAIYITWGTDLSGTNPSAVGTTTMIFIIILIIFGVLCGILRLIFETFKWI